MKESGKVYVVGYKSMIHLYGYSLLPLLPPSRLVLSVGIGVTSSILPIFIPFLAKALRAAWAPGPGVLLPVPP